MSLRLHHGWAGQSVIQLSLLVYFLPNILMFTSLRRWGSLRCSIVDYGGELVVYYTGNGGLPTVLAMVVYGGLLAVNWATAQCRRAQGPQFGAVVVEIT